MEWSRGRDGVEIFPPRVQLSMPGDNLGCYN